MKVWCFILGTSIMDAYVYQGELPSLGGPKEVCEHVHEVLYYVGWCTIY